MDYQTFSLPNGIRLLYKPVASTIAHACIIANAGSRDEPESESGLAHFIEHLLFKRTEKRTTNQILNRLENVGGDLNAYTTKEYTCIHASFLNPYLERALDLFEDLVFHSIFPENELEKEKSVILDEIASYQDQPEEAINDDFEDLLFKDHELGRNILGTPDSVSGLTRKHIQTFIRTNYNTEEIIVGILGEYDFNKLKTLFSKIFLAIPKNTPSRNRIKPVKHEISSQIIKKPIAQTHCVLGSQAYSTHHEYKTGLLLLNNILGGMGMSSRLNLEIREKHGIAYTIESNYTPLTDTGIFSIYFGTDTEKTEKALKLVNRELKKLTNSTLGTVQLHQAKQKFIGQIALAEENRMGLLLSMTKSLLDYDRVDAIEEVFAKINQVSAKQLLEIANEITDPSRLTTLIFTSEA